MTEMQELQALYFDMSVDRVPVVELAAMLGLPRVADVCALVDPVHVMVRCGRCQTLHWKPVGSREQMKRAQRGHWRTGLRTANCTECAATKSYRRFNVPEGYQGTPEHHALGQRLGVDVGDALGILEDLEHQARDLDGAVIGTIWYVHRLNRQQRQKRLAIMPYREYLATPEWAEKRKQALARAGHRCQLCNGRERLEVHHRTYDRRGAERPDDLVTLCRSCHARHHGKSA